MSLYLYKLCVVVTYVHQVFMLYMYHVQYICISYIPILFIVAFVLHTTDGMNIGSHAYSLVIWGHCYFISSALELDILINITSLQNHEIVKVPMYNYGLRFRALPFAISILFAYRMLVQALNKVASQAHLSLWHFLSQFWPIEFINWSWRSPASVDIIHFAQQCNGISGLVPAIV